jgi:hypothetical protein
LRAASTLRTGAPMDPIAQGGAMAVDPEQFYAMRGISTEGAANQQLVDLLRPVRGFCGRYSRNEDAPDINAALAVIPTLSVLDTAISVRLKAVPLHPFFKSYSDFRENTSQMGDGPAIIFV